MPAGVLSVTYASKASRTSRASWSATSRKDSLACASFGMMVLPPGPVCPPQMPLTSAVGRAQIRSSVLKPRSPALAWLSPASASQDFSSKGSRASSSRSAAVSGTTSS